MRKRTPTTWVIKCMGLALGLIAGWTCANGYWLLGLPTLAVALMTARYENDRVVWMLSKYYIRESSDGLRYDVVCKGTGLIWFTGNCVEVSDELKRLENRS